MGFDSVQRNRTSAAPSFQPFSFGSTSGSSAQPTQKTSTLASKLFGDLFERPGSTKPSGGVLGSLFGDSFGKGIHHVKSCSYGNKPTLPPTNTFAGGGL